jgi:hypothetical protein
MTREQIIRDTLFLPEPVRSSVRDQLLHSLERQERVDRIPPEQRLRAHRLG